MKQAFWYQAAHILRAYCQELSETESSLSEEVLVKDKQIAHLEIVLIDYRDALRQAQSLISALEQDREKNRIEAYKKGLIDNNHPTEAVDAPSTLPHLDATDENLKTKWFRSQKEATTYAHNAGFRQRPERRRVWLDLAWREEWSLRVPVECA